MCTAERGGEIGLKYASIKEYHYYTNNTSDKHYQAGESCQDYDEFGRLRKLEHYELPSPPIHKKASWANSSPSSQKSKKKQYENRNPFERVHKATEHIEDESNPKGSPQGY